MPVPEPFSPTEREYYANFKELVRDRLPSGKQLFSDLYAAFERFFETEGIILSRRERYRLFLLIMEEVSAELAAELQKLQP
jgi:hypothetical protein